VPGVDLDTPFPKHAQELAAHPRIVRGQDLVRVGEQMALWRHTILPVRGQQLAKPVLNCQQSLDTSRAAANDPDPGWLAAGQHPFA
jgi:hypothetical protein